VAVAIAVAAGWRNRALATAVPTVIDVVAAKAAWHSTNESATASATKKAFNLRSSAADASSPIARADSPLRLATDTAISIDTPPAP